MGKFIDVEAARALTGLRLVLTTNVPGPWGEAAKGMFHVKGIPFARVRQEGGGANEALAAWTGQTSAPVAVWNDERPRTTSLEILFLAERLAPEPALIPDDPDERARMLGYCHEIIGEQGLGWSRRLTLLHPILAATGDSAPAPLQRMAGKYGYSGDAAAAATDRIVAILRMLAAQLERQRAAGRRFLIGDRLSALDVYWSTFAAMFAPLPEDLCPMQAGMRQLYSAGGPVRDALDPALLAHRDFVYREYLELPVDCNDG
jgi:glutathione S-transferase